jgi:hypothetical protein
MPTTADFLTELIAAKMVANAVAAERERCARRLAWRARAVETDCRPRRPGWFAFS